MAKSSKAVSSPSITEQMTELSELVEQARIAEPEIMDAAVTANLDRLCKLGVIDRPRKGYYAANDQSNAYLVELNIEIDARGLKQ